MASVSVAGTEEFRRSEAESRSISDNPVYAEVIQVVEVDSDPRAAF